MRAGSGRGSPTHARTWPQVCGELACAGAVDSCQRVRLCFGYALHACMHEQADLGPVIVLRRMAAETQESSMHAQVLGTMYISLSGLLHRGEVLFCYYSWMLTRKPDLAHGRVACQCSSESIGCSQLSPPAPRSKTFTLPSPLT